MKSFLHILLLFLLITQLAFPQWTNQNPVPDGNDLWSTFFIEDTGWIVGSEGFIKKTTNAGLDWVLQESNTTLLLRSVQFINQNTGWICGESGLILKTSDGGINWNSLASGTTQNLTDIQFCTPDIGYVTGFTGTILKTTNGGSVWTSLSSGTTNDLYSLDFVDAFSGYAVGGADTNYSILKTTDGGLNWIEKPHTSLPTELSSLNTVEFVDANTGWIGGGDDGPYSWGFIYKTTDGGESWTYQNLYLLKKTEPIHKENFTTYYGDGIRSIFFKDPNNGYAVGGYFWQFGNQRRILTTTNGGLTWIEKNYESWHAGLLSVYVNSIGKGWAVGYAGVIFITEDNGDSWAQILSGSGSGTCAAPDIYSLFFINENIGWAGGYRGFCAPDAENMILKTTNGGKIWRRQYFDPWGGPTISSLYFINEYIGWAITEEGGFYRTTDGGENWISSGGISGSSIFFINQDTGWVANDNEHSSYIGIYKTTDGGITWVQKRPISSSSIYFNDANTGWAVGAGGSILKSTDGGESWITKVSGTTNDLKWVKFYNSNLGMCVGNTGTVLLSTDGGESWISNSVGTTENLTSVTFTNSTTVWIAGYNGTILNTTDLGYNWTSYDSVTTNDLTSLSFVNEYTGWFGGMNGTMFKYSVQPPPPPVWSNQISVEDAGGTESSQVLTFGQHIDATDSLDSFLNEYELPPLPPTGIFDARFNLPTNPQVSSLIDYRDSAKTDIIWTMTFQPGTAGYPMTFSWDSTSFPEGTFYLKDRINGSFVNVNMKKQSSYSLTNPVITSLSIIYKGASSIVDVNNGWNMISVPLLAEDMSLSNLFPAATSMAYGFEGSYVTEDTLVGGKGYWLKFDGNQQVQIYGSRMGDSIPLETGWNMFGAYEEDIPISQITTTPPGIVATYFFEYQDGYYIADTLNSGQGYWVRVTQDGILNLNSGGLMKDGEQVQFAEIDKSWGKIKITDSRGKSITLYATEDETESNFYELPPMPPTGIFDARFSSGRIVEDISNERIIQISSDSYPITIRAKGINIAVRDIINGELLNQELKNGEELRITNNKITSIGVTGRITDGLPVTYELYQNYPNPFNPSTVIEFSLPEDVGNVKLSVYNTLGEKVAELVNTALVAGKYSYQWNAQNVATGMYIYELRTDKFVSVKKMLLMK